MDLKSTLFVFLQLLLKQSDHPVKKRIGLRAVGIAVIEREIALVMSSSAYRSGTSVAVFQVVELIGVGFFAYDGGSVIVLKRLLYLVSGVIEVQDKGVVFMGFIRLIGPRAFARPPRWKAVCQHTWCAARVGQKPV